MHNIWLLQWIIFLRISRNRLQNIHRICQIAHKICAEHGGDPAVFYAKFQNDLTIELHIVGKIDFTRFEFKMCFRRISYVATAPWGPFY